MKKSSDFSEVLDATERLSLEERETLVEVLHHRTVEERRELLKREVLESRREFAAGKCRPASPSQIMRDILK